ncbi:MAG TPA: polysaccharide biosynthesis tyrosine autokinase [Solirubrobacteraceae bacterium]|jgi:capsular exopolysaccharide synthesis family protein
MDTEHTNLSLEQVAGVLRRRAPWILLCFALVTAAAYGFSKHQAKQYTATASLVFGNNQLGQQVAGLPAASSTSQQALQNTNLKLVKLGDMAAKTASQLGRGLTKQKVSASLSVSGEGESNIVNVSATATSPALAAAIANTYTSQFVTEQQDSNHAYYASALALVNKQLAGLSPRQRAGTAGLALEDRAQSLGTLAELRNGNVQVAQAASVPTSSSSPRVARNTFLGGVVGLLLGLIVAFLLERFDRRIREPKDLEAIYGLPLLGVVPEIAALTRTTRNRTAASSLSAGEAETFDLIRAHLRYCNVDRELHALLIASAGPGDGKTTVARHLAEAAVMMGSRTLLLEVDLRRPTLAKQLDLRFGPGLSDVLIGAISLGEATQSIDVDLRAGRRSCGRTLDVLVAGSIPPPNPAELLESRTMESVLQATKSIYDLVIIDTPPLTAVSDAFPLLRKVDGVVIVGRIGRNRRDVAERLHETLNGVGAPLLGVIANGLKSRGFGAYGYDYAYTQEERPAAAGPANGAGPPKGIHWPNDEGSENGAGSDHEPTPAAER